MIIFRKKIFLGMVVLLLGTLGLFGSVQLVQKRSFERSDAALPDVVVSKAVEDAAQKNEKIRVLVKVNASFQVANELDDSKRPTQRESIKSKQLAVESGLGRIPFKTIYNYDSVPYMAMEVTPQSLAQLKTLKGVVLSIEEDGISTIQLRESRVIIGADIAEKTASGFGATIAIIDTGVESTHPFLKNKVINEVCFGKCPNGSNAQEGPGSAAPCTESKDCYHGTAVAGAAVGVGAPGTLPASYAGIAKSAVIIPIKIGSVFCPDANDASKCFFGAYDSEILSAFNWIWDHRAVYYWGAVNMSLSTGDHTDYCNEGAIPLVINNLSSIGVPVVLTTGNTGSVDKISGWSCVATSISAAATTKDDKMTWFSNVSPKFNNILLAPGEDITTSTINGGQITTSGTSFSAPMISGAFALLRTVDPTASVSKMFEALKNTGVMVPDTRAGAPAGAQYPRIQLDKAVEYLKNGGGATQSCTATSGSSGNCTFTN